MKNILLYFVLLTAFANYAQQSHRVSLNWNPNSEYAIGENTVKIPHFQAANFDFNTALKTIFFRMNVPLSSFVDQNSLQITAVSYQNMAEQDLFDLDKSKIPTSISPKIEVISARDVLFASISFSPIIKEGTLFKQVTEISFTINENASSNRTSNASQTAGIGNSVLASGNWYKFFVEKSGVYKISKSFLQSLGLNTAVDPRTIKIYGNGGRMLPLLNDTSYPEDLEENAIRFIGEEDGAFDANDYILFYAEGVDQWNSESGTSINLFADKTYYYVTASSGLGKRIENAPEITATPNVVFNQFDDIVYYEKDLVNVVKIGRRWFGEQFIIKDKQIFDFTIPNLVTSSPVEYKINTASVSYAASSFSVKMNNQDVGSINFIPLDPLSSNKGFETAKMGNFTTTSPTISVELTYDNGGVPSSNGYLDYIRLKAKRNLIGYGKQFHFSNDETATNIGVGQFDISNATAISEVWNISDIYNVSRFANTSGASFSFKINLGTASKFIAVDLNDALLPGKDANFMVANQNLKGTLFKDGNGNFQDIDYLIFTPKFLVSQAESLANFHRSYSQLNVRVVALENVYEEFSSGKQDVAAIRNLVRYVYWNASSPEKRVKYINLFGDASYDYKNRIPNNNNIVPVFHGFNPNGSEYNNAANLSLFESFMSDDFFGLMDLGEGPMVNSADGIDIAVGRMPVSTTTEAQDMVNKVIEYHDEKSYGRWRNNYVIYSDDADSVSDASLQIDLNSLADVLVSQKPFINVKKIHSDAYIQQIASGGERYPEAKKDFLDALALGGLVFNYFGHGSEEALARERLFEKLDAQNLTNRYRYPLFITITCEFTRFDDPNRKTGGEYMFWNKQGGAIALIATTRQIGVTTGLEMNNLLSQRLFAFGSTNYPTISEALRLTKITNNSTNRRVVFLVGDPALKLAIPKPKVVLTKVNDVAVNQPLPVLQALSSVKITGEVRDENDSLLSTYNGDLAVQIFDKDINRSTLGNNGISNGGSVIIMNFSTLGETVFRGNASVVNGKFEFSFIMPQDIRIPVGNGKISFYAKRNSPNLEDQTGYDKNIKIGGVNANAPLDTTPPTANLYMNDESFVSGGITNCAPILYAKLFDASGINTASGIGHDIIAILDGNETTPYILNEYYETENNDFTKGFVRFPFRNLAPGMHTIVFKAWDVYNNLITTEIQFNAICSNEGLVLERVLNYPNPFVNYTEFWFHHNMPFETLEVQVQILTVSGKIVKSINQNVVTDGFLCREIKWDGKDDFGDKIGKGTYIYQLKVKSISTGKKVEKFEKLVIL